jgi:hypothetical protein
MSASNDPQRGAEPPRNSAAAPAVGWFALGMALFGAVVVAGFFAVGSLPIQGQGPPIQIAGAILLLATAAGALFAMRRRRVALGSGLLTGYALATAFSAGQCTLWSANPGYEMITGFFVYVLALGLAGVLFVIVLVAEAIMRARRPPPTA